jgi:hypothetical protein
MKKTKVRMYGLLVLAFILSGCAHLKNGNGTMKQGDEYPVRETDGDFLMRKIEYTPDHVFSGYREYFYNEDCQLAKETVYNKKGNLKEVRFFEYVSGKLSKQVIKNRENGVEEIREYLYSEDILVEKNVKKSNNSTNSIHHYIYKDGLLERESIVNYNENETIEHEYYYLYFYDGTKLVRREKYDKAEPSDVLKETRNYFYENTKIIREEEFDEEVNKTTYVVYEYGNHMVSSDHISDSALYEEVFSDDLFHEFIVEISREEWHGMTRDMLDYAKKHPVTLLYPGDGRPYRTGNYRKATFIYKRPDGDEIVLEEVGIRTRGNESRRLPEKNGKYQKTHFKIRFDETFDMDKNTFEYIQRNNRRFAGMKALNFKWSRYNRYDAYPNKTKINELFSYELLEKAGVIVPKMSLVTLTFRIDGKEVDYGIYGIVEHVDKAFLKKRFGKDNDGDLYKCLYLGTGPHLTPESIYGTNIGIKNFDTNYRPIYDLKTNTKTADHSQLKDFIDKLNTTRGEDFVGYIEGKFEVDRFIRFCAMGIYISNLDDYRFLANNYYLYFSENGKIEFIPYDYDISLGTGWHGEMGYKQFIDQDIFNTTSIPESWGDFAKRPLVDKILEIEKYRKTYVEYLKEYIKPANKLFLFSEYRAKFEKLNALYKGEDANDTSDKDPMGWQGFESDYFYDKTKNVLDQLQIPYVGYEVD